MEDGSKPKAPANIDMSNLTNAIVQIFTIILLGYIAGRTGVISKVHAAGIGRFISRFCLPSLIFRNMCLLDFTVVNWTFLLGIFLAKVSLFLLVSVSTVVIKRPFDLGLAGIFSVFTIQSNDFAFGYPIVQAIYSKSHPEYIKYIYLVAPISLAILNPIGFIMMEFQRTINSRNQSGGLCKALGKVLKGIAMNPIVNMTITGIIFNFILKSSLPQILDNIFLVLAHAFNAGALFFLGLSLVGKVQGKLGMSLLVPFLLVVAKSLLLPLFAWGILQRLDHSENSTSFSMYGFLYGTIPTTPSLYIFANDFGFGTDIIATALVLGNALAAPLMFVSAKMMTVYVDTAQDFKRLLYDTSFDMSIISIVCCVWVIILFVFTGKWKRVPFRFTMAYMVSILSGHGALDANIAVVLCLLHVRSESTVLRIQTWLYFVGFGLPMIMTGIQFILGHRDVQHEINPTFHYGKCQALFSLSALLVCFCGTVTSLVWWLRSNRHPRTLENGLLIQKTDYDDTTDTSDNGGGISTMSSKSIGAKSDVDTAIVDLPVPNKNVPESFNESTPLLYEGANLQQFAAGTLSDSTNSNDTQVSTQHKVEIHVSNATQMLTNEYQSTQHLVLLLPLIFSMFVAVVLCLWKLFQGIATGIYVEIEFLDIVLNYGQGILVFLVFGFESGILFSPMIRRVRYALLSSQTQNLPRLTESGDFDAAKQTCDQFTKYHLEICCKEIVRDRRVDTRNLLNVFSGMALCDYLIRCGLAVDRSSAIEYGCHLFLGKVIISVSNEQNFRDALLYYKFKE
ncbi:hypothetical protein RRG08_047248 [Elysia crispata]|uniref:DEP domain-containing protein n=1 Tax=Elysia crispata TaxID=231223 RepID=A0AAE1A2W5_9GAST|nr:hypothetical protein RRG08_047248 [Elysia crispata]